MNNNTWYVCKWLYYAVDSTTDKFYIIFSGTKQECEKYLKYYSKNYPTHIPHKLDVCLYSHEDLEIIMI